MRALSVHSPLGDFRIVQDNGYFFPGRWLPPSQSRLVLERRFIAEISKLGMYQRLYVHTYVRLPIFEGTQQTISFHGK